MKTEISDFCKEYANVLAPLDRQLASAIECVQNESQEDVLRLSLAGLSDVRHRLTTLSEKVECQQAYLLIFGPLKSGKSTLMNAISGSYVSEVTSLPAYPCLVYVRNGADDQLSVTRYNGRRTTFSDNKIMQALVADSHTNLADRIRMVEEQDGSFDPGVHYPEAIRRIDIELRARNLKESGTVLVDTPGLYSRMKFGYDLMTREFRNNAACAVFVVKTDNLFLEQVFDEFNELLGMFSRVFLVVNIDSNKRDLLPDGSLKPSLESSEPQRIIDAFQTLSMSAPLRKAADDGRLKIYPIDLLHAASKYLSEHTVPGATGAEAAPAKVDLESEESNEADDSESNEIAEAPEVDKPKAVEGGKDRGAADFERFLSELTDYLNSSDYLQEFMRDSLLQGVLLGEDIKSHCTKDALGEFLRQQLRLNERLDDVSSKLEAVSQLERTDWDAAFERTSKTNVENAVELSKEIRGKVMPTLLGSLDDWFGMDGSLNELQQGKWNPALKDALREVTSRSVANVRSLVSDTMGGADISPQLVICLDRVLLALGDIQKAALPSVKDSGLTESLEISINAEQIPVKRGFFDRILFRSASTVRRRLFGVQDSLQNKIAPDKKSKKLSPDGRTELVNMIDNHLKSVLPANSKRHAEVILKSYVDAFKKQLNVRLAEVKQDLIQSKEQLNTRITANGHVAEELDNLQKEVASVLKEIKPLAERFSCRFTVGPHAFRRFSRPTLTSLWTAPYLGGVIPKTVFNKQLSLVDDFEQDEDESFEPEDRGIRVAVPSIAIPSAEGDNELEAEVEADAPEEAEVEVEAKVEGEVVEAEVVEAEVEDQPESETVPSSDSVDEEKSKDPVLVVTPPSSEEEEGKPKDPILLGGSQS